MRVIATALTIGALLGSPAAAADIDLYWGRENSGNKLLAFCEYERGTTEHMWCVAFISGAVGMMTMLEPGAVCLRQNTSLKQIMDATIQYMRINPQNRNESAASMVGLTLLTYWPCAKS